MKLFLELFDGFSAYGGLPCHVPPDAPLPSRVEAGVVEVSCVCFSWRFRFGGSRVAFEFLCENLPGAST